MAGRLSWRHHTLIQSLLCRGPLKEPDFQSVFSSITGKNPVTHPQLFNDFLLKINKELAYVQFELRGCRNQYDGQVYYGVVNNVEDDQSKLGTKYSVPQIAFYKAMIEAIVQDITTQGSVTAIEALNIRLENQVQAGQSSEDSQSRILRNFTKSQKEKTVNDLIKDQWLCCTSDGKIGLGVRSFLDLRSWFRNNDIPSCNVCNEAGVKVITCPKEDCPVRIHDYCLKKKFSQRKVARVCPGCSTAWDLPEFPEEEEEQEEEEEEGGRQEQGANVASSSGRFPRRKLRSLKAEAVEADDFQSQLLSSGPLLRKRRKSCKTEAVQAAEAEQPSTSNNPRTRLRSCKAEAAQAAEADVEAEQPTTSNNPITRRRSRRM